MGSGHVYDFPQKNFSMCHGTYSPIPDPSKNWSVKYTFSRLPSRVLVPITFWLRVRLEEKRVDTTDTVQS